MKCQIILNTFIIVLFVSLIRAEPSQEVRRFHESNFKMKLLKLLFNSTLLLQTHPSPTTAIYQQHRNETIVYRSANNQRDVTLEDLDGFKKLHYIKEKIVLPIQEISPKNTITNDGTDYALEDAAIFDVFAPDATYMHNGVESAPPQNNRIYQIDNADEHVLIVKSPERNNDVATISILKKETGKTTELQRVADGILVTVQPNDYDEDAFDRDFRYGEGIVVEDGNDELETPSLDRSWVEEGFSKKECLSWRQIRFSIAYDTSFCEKNGGTQESADSRALEIISFVSHKYKQKFLCVDVILSHLEGYCDINLDPYQDMVNMNDSGCEGGGLLQRFQDYWNSNKTKISRDTTHLFSGTKLECEGRQCTVGCAYHHTTCMEGKSYGVNNACFSGSANKVANLVAHEFGHSNGALHYNDGDGTYLMEPSVNSGTSGFSRNSIAMMKAYLAVRSCGRIRLCEVAAGDLIPKFLRSRINNN